MRAQVLTVFILSANILDSYLKYLLVRVDIRKYPENEVSPATHQILTRHLEHSIEWKITDGRIPATNTSMNERPASRMRIGMVYSYESYGDIKLCNSFRDFVTKP